ncbi:SURF1 family protein [Parashewanella tropica]|uniref:SURF1 family protein n=1 Tax=Parashewanella tropica TaxID=2547970 RepID=UPI001478FCD0|nr:SURF1 family protein [Parashewanella tropica]
MLVSLGFWQLKRGDQNQRFEQNLRSRSQHQLSYSQIENTHKVAELTGYQTHLTLAPVSKPLLYLDNQIMGQQVGYEVYQVMQYQPNLPWVLVDLGFIAAFAERNNLPEVKPIERKMKVVGTLYHTDKNPFSSKLLPEIGKEVRIQNMNYKELSLFLGHSVLGIAVQAKQAVHSVDGRLLIKRIHKLAMPSSKNYGYAVQWFAMATTLAVIGLFSIFKRNRLDGDKIK